MGCKCSKENIRFHFQVCILVIRIHFHVCNFPCPTHRLIVSFFVTLMTSFIDCRALLSRVCRRLATPCTCLFLWWPCRRGLCMRKMPVLHLLPFLAKINTVNSSRLPSNNTLLLLNCFTLSGNGDCFL